MYVFELKESLNKDLEKLSRKNRPLLDEVRKKIKQIVENPYIGKPLKNVMKGKRRVHLGHFVLIYEVLENDHKIIFLKFAHHDNAY